MTASTTPPRARARSAGDLLRAWRTKRRLSHMELALRAGVSPRHLSFVENGRSQASAELLGALADVLELPLREANALAGHRRGDPQLWRLGPHLLRELQRLAGASLDEALWSLLEEVRGYDNVRALLAAPPPAASTHELLVPCVLDLHGRRLAMFTTLASFGSPRDVTLAELTVELFYPADDATGAALRSLDR